MLSLKSQNAFSFIIFYRLFADLDESLKFSLDDWFSKPCEALEAYDAKFL